LPLLERASVTGDDGEVLTALLRALAAVRGVPTALTCHEEYRATLADSLGVDPSPELRALHVELLASDRPVRSGVRYDADRLVGREADVAAVRVLVRAHRVVSIIGTGGLGKTRLAHLIARSAGQPVVVELAGVTSPAGVAIAVADALGVRESVAGRAVALRSADLLTRLLDAVGTVPRRCAAHQRLAGADRNCPDHLAAPDQPRHGGRLGDVEPQQHRHPRHHPAAPDRQAGQRQRHRGRVPLRRDALGIGDLITQAPTS
jgi:Bacterial transcriptional activator domain